ncbi:MAG: YggS family pyridoxal phosphate-dependent enzyme [Anaerolineae bacterium]|nr:YggS family pyridoxal phosphate-dependent enzyme [Anaerolineae bacterium]
MTVIDIKANLDAVQERIATACARANRNPDEVTLVAVSKKKPIEAIVAANLCGMRHFGENRVEEAMEKIPVVNEQVDEKPVWHMIGHIQSRKAKLVEPLFDVVHSIDTLKIAEKLSQLASESQRTLPVLLEVNISGEAAKYGFEASDWKNKPAIKANFWDTVAKLQQLPYLDIRGLMTMAPFYDDMERTRPIFADLAELREHLQSGFHVALPDLSMGMTNDFPIAIEEGATILRIGRAIFGERA